MEKLYGVVQKITYFNKENGYGIIRIKLNYKDKKIAIYKAKLFTNELTVLCHFDRAPLEDEEYDFEGDFINSQYGLQFKATTFLRRSNETLEGVVSYLSSELFPQIGKVTASKIFTSLGPKCLEKIRNDKKVLDDVEGLTDIQKDTIYDNLITNYLLESNYVELTSLGITMAAAAKIISVLKEKSITVIKENPYQLIDLIEGIGFSRADKIAKAVGISPDSPIRLKAYINYSLKEYIYSSGNTFIEKHELFEKLIEIFNTEDEILNKDLFEDILNQLVLENKIIVNENQEVYEYYAYKAEESLALSITNYLGEVYDYGYKLADIDKAIEKVTKYNKITYNTKQLQAIKLALKENLMIITGGPGTGKSTVIKGIVEAYKVLIGNELVEEDIALLAPTGRASKRLCEVPKAKAQTIHKFLGYIGENKFTHGPNNPTYARLVIIDEMSMVDVVLAARLFASLPNQTKIVIVGDVDQLPSVGPGEVLANLIECEEITVVKLDQIHRQASDSTIVKLAHDVNHGLLPENILEKQEDRNFISLDDNDITEGVIKVVKQGLNKGMDIVKDIQVLVPLYKGELGINHLNAKMQEAFNPLVDEEITHLSRKFRVNDKVIQLVNRVKKQVMNGDIGYVISLDIVRNQPVGLTVLFDSGPVDYKVEELEDLTHAYAISIHKSQGSEFPLVVIPYTNRYFIMLRRKLIYTAITRAKKYLIMLGNPEALNRGTKQIESARKTNLITKIKEKIGKPQNSLTPYDFLD